MFLFQLHNDYSYSLVSFSSLISFFGFNSSFPDVVLVSVLVLNSLLA